ncbi:MAG: PQQ-binding-like beta-propeller repeat protein [Candidatus Acidiferrales bacterium]
MPAHRLGISVVGFFAAAVIIFSLVVTVRTRAQEEQEKSAHSTWSTYLGNADSSHYSSLTQINLSNVDRLQVAWKYEEGVDRAYEFSPIVVGRTMYVMARKTSVVALDAATGKELWVYHSKYAPAWEMHRGINFWQSKDGRDQRLFIPVASHLEAINAKTGELITSFGIDGRVDLREGLERDFNTISQIQSATPGVVYGDLLILGSSTGEEYGSPPGDIRAYDVRTGKMVWIFHTVPHPGEPGYETWPKDTWKYEGGTNCWGEMSLDVDRGIVYVPTGAPTYDFYGADRIGNNLYADTLLALDARTGKLIWYQQLVHHDLWDYDLTAAPQLLTVRHDGQEIPIVAQATKNGFLYVFNRVTGKPLWPIEERPVPKSDMPGEVASPTQPFPTKPPPFAVQSFTSSDLDPYILTADERAKWKAKVDASVNKGLFTPPGLTDTVEMPGNHGGANWGSTASNPNNGSMFVLSMNIPAFLKNEHLLPPNLWEIPMDVAPAEQGKAIYHLYCQRCHGIDRQGSPPSIPSLVNAPKNFGEDVIRTVVKNGIQEMPAFPDLSTLHLTNLMLYLGNPDLAPGPLEELKAPPPQTAGGTAAPVKYWSGYNLFTSIIKPPWSTITAYDLNTGTIKWQIPFGEAPPAAKENLTGSGVMMPRNGPVVTAGGLIFAASKYEGTLHAYDQKTGKEVWSAVLPAASEGVPAVYEVDGQEYIVVCATTGKDTDIPRDGPSQPTATPPQRSYIAYALPKNVASR